MHTHPNPIKHTYSSKTHTHTCVLQQNEELVAQLGTNTTLLDFGNNMGISASVFFFSNCQQCHVHHHATLPITRQSPSTRTC